MESTERELLVAVPARGLVLLIGASGSGKSTFAARHFEPTEILSSDRFRAMVGDDEADQSATAAAFDVLLRVLAHRLRRGRLSVVDATNARPTDRRRLLLLAGTARRPTAGIVFALPLETSRAQNRTRPGRSVDDAVVTRQAAEVRRSAADPDALLSEGLSVLHILDSTEDVDRVRVVRDASIPRAAGGASSPSISGPAERTRGRARRVRTS